MKEPVLLIVDDEPYTAAAVKRVFRTDPIRVLTAASAEEALDVLDQLHVDMVIADYHMPLMNGVELINRIYDRSPEIINILLTGQANLQFILMMVEADKVLKVVKKPWDTDDLRETVTSALRDKALL